MIKLCISGGASLFGMCMVLLAPASACLAEDIPEWSHYVAPAVGALAPPVTYYASPAGLAANDGLSTQHPLPIQAAADRTNPGDTVLLMDGVYGYDGGGSLLSIARSGAPGAYITYRPAPNAKPVLKATRGWNHMVITGSFIVVNGLTVEGNNDNLTLADGMANYDYHEKTEPAKRDWTKISRTNTNGISIDGRDLRKKKLPPPHHIIIRNCTVSKCPGGGMGPMEADYVLMENNLVFGNAWYMIYGGSGMGTLNALDVDDNTVDYKMILRNNVVHHNRTDVPWAEIKKISDGNGIIIDDNTNTQIGQPHYKGRTLVANNVCYENGGSGIHVFSSGNADVINNTVYANNQRPELQWGNLFANRSSDCLIANNIVVATPGGKINGDSGCELVIYANNIYFGGKPNVMGPGDRVIDPGFVDLGKRDFRLRDNSPAVDMGTLTRAPAKDITGAARPLGKGIDIGAYESPYTSPTPLANATLDLDKLMKAIPFVALKTEAMRGTVQVDGVVDAAWATAASIHTMKFMPGGELKSKGAMAEVKTLWDDTNLYVLAIVQDSHVSTASKDPWDQDSVEVFIDENHARSKSHQDDDRQYRVNADGVKTAKRASDVQTFTAAVSRTKSGYIVEIAIPFRAIKPAAGTVIGFDAQVNSESGNGTRESCAVWCDPTGNGYNSTEKWGDLKLVTHLSEPAKNVTE